MKTTQIRTSKGYLFRTYCKQQRTQSPSYAFGRDSKASKRRERYVVKKGEDFRYALPGGCWHGGEGSRLARVSGQPM